MSKLTIFLDMDGVIADFNAHALEHNKFKAGTNEIDCAALDQKWWSSVPVYNGALEFYHELSKYAKVKFLTGPALNPECHGGKAEWISRFDPKRGSLALNDMIICRASDKYLLAQPDRILIDDYKANTDAWNEAGGISFLHKGDFSKTRTELEIYLTKRLNKNKHSMHK